MTATKKTKRYDELRADVQRKHCTGTLTFWSSPPWISQVFFRSDHTYVTLKAPLKAIDQKPTPEQTAHLLTIILRAPDHEVVSCDGVADMRAIERVWATKAFAGDSSHSPPSGHALAP